VGYHCIAVVCANCGRFWCLHCGVNKGSEPNPDAARRVQQTVAASLHTNKYENETCLCGSREVYPDSAAMVAKVEPKVLAPETRDVTLRKNIERIRNEYDKQLMVLLRMVREDFILPLCHQYGLTFVSHQNGDFHFIEVKDLPVVDLDNVNSIQQYMFSLYRFGNSSTIPAHLQNVMPLQELIELLRTQTSSGRIVAHYVESFTHPDDPLAKAQKR
jgi:hypothetical protein